MVLKNSEDQHLESVPEGIKAVLKAKGGPTEYRQGVPDKVANDCVKSMIAVLNPGSELDSSQNRTLSMLLGLAFGYNTKS